MAVFNSSSSVCGLIVFVFFVVSHLLACLLYACMSPLCLRVVSLHPCLMLFICPSFPLVCTLCVVDAHKPPSSYGTHVARWFGARKVQFFVSAARLLLVFASIHLPCCWSAPKSLAPRARTLLAGLGHATLSFFAVVTLLFVFFCECPKFCDLAKQRCKIFGGVSEVGKGDFSLYFFWRCVVFSAFFFFCCDRATSNHPSIGGGVQHNMAEHSTAADSTAQEPSPTQARHTAPGKTQNTPHHRPRHHKTSRTTPHNTGHHNQRGGGGAK